MRTSRGPRVIRGLLASSIATFAALMSHVAAGGSVPGILGIAVPWVLSLFVCVLLAGRSLSLLRLSLSVVLSQTLFHVLFVLGSFSAAMPMGAGHHHGHTVVASASASAAEAGALAALRGDAAMWLAHAFAAAVTIAVLHRGERTVRSGIALVACLRSWVRLVVLRLIAPVLAPVRRRIAAVVLPARILARDRHLAPLSRRGPPLPAAS